MRWEITILILSGVLPVVCGKWSLIIIFVNAMFETRTEKIERLELDIIKLQKLIKEKNEIIEALNKEISKLELKINEML